jgi:hypothetical protein
LVFHIKGRPYEGVCECVVEKDICAEEREEVIRDGKNCASSTNTNILRVSKSRRMGWVGHVARVGKRRGAYQGFYVET